MSESPSPPEAGDAWAQRPPAVRAIHARLLLVVPTIATHLRPDATFLQCGADSLDFVELMCAVEADYGVRLTTDEIAAVKTIGELLAIIDQRAITRPAP